MSSEFSVRSTFAPFRRVTVGVPSGEPGKDDAGDELKNPGRGGKKSIDDRRFGSGLANAFGAENAVTGSESDGGCSASGDGGAVPCDGATCRSQSATRAAFVEFPSLTFHTVRSALARRSMGRSARIWRAIGSAVGGDWSVASDGSGGRELVRRRCRPLRKPTGAVADEFARWRGGESGAGRLGFRSRFG